MPAAPLSLSKSPAETSQCGLSVRGHACLRSAVHSCIFDRRFRNSAEFDVFESAIGLRRDLSHFREEQKCDCIGIAGLFAQLTPVNANNLTCIRLLMLGSPMKGSC
jgi:hypothetical protein